MLKTPSAAVSKRNPEAPAPITAPERANAVPTGSVEIPISYYWLLLRRYQWRIITFTVLVTIGVSLFALTRPKIYESDAVVRIDPSGVHVVGESSAQGASAGDARLLIGTEANVIKSPAVVSQVIESLHLDEVPEIAAFAPPTLAPSLRAERILRAVTNQISIAQPLDTYLLEIHFKAQDPVLAATIANSLSTAFLDNEYATRARALTDSTRYLKGQVDTMRARMESDQTELIRYETSNDVSDPDDKTNIYQARLTQMNTDLTQAQSARMALEAVAQGARSGDMDALLASPRGQSLVPLRDRYLSDQRELARLLTVYGDAHPLVVQQQEITRKDLAALNDELDHVRAQIESQFQVAVDRETLASQSLLQEKKAFDDFSLRAVKYHALKVASDNSTNLYYDLQKQIQDATVAAGQRSEDLRVISEALPVHTPVSPRVALWIIVALVLSTMVGVGSSIVVGIMDKSVSNPDQVEGWYHVPVIASLPVADTRSDPMSVSPLHFRADVPESSGGGNAVALQRHSAFQEAMLALHSSLAFGGGNEILAVSSAAPGEGKTTVSTNLASVFALLGKRTLILDADMRKPSVHRNFQIENRIGLSSMLRRRCSLAEGTVHLSPNLSVIPAGPSIYNPAELLHMGFEQVLDQIRSQYDFILVDCPPVLGFADTINVVSLVPNIVLVAYAGQTDRGALGASIRQLNSVGANIVGVLLNRVSSEMGHYYGYYSHSSYKYYSRAQE